MRAALRIRAALVPFRASAYFFDDLCAKLTDDLPRLLTVIETSVSALLDASSRQDSCSEHPIQERTDVWLVV